MRSVHVVGRGAGGGGAPVDAVDIMLLHNQHEAAAVEAFQAGLHVLLEKPMSISVPSIARVMAAAARAADQVFWVAEQEQYAPAILTAQRASHTILPSPYEISVQRGDRDCCKNSSEL
eukprot:COSAG01_NODE_6570_length_3603_cov_7.710046_2_plen_118_part_00